MRNNDFTLEKYKDLCMGMLASGYKILTVRDFLVNSHPVDSYVIVLRHDVDRFPANAFKMAALEKDLGVASTYYFRFNESSLKNGSIKKISDLGHEVGYHYEVFAKANGNYPIAIEMFRKELYELRKLADISTICMHGSPLSRWDNRLLWGKYNFSEFNILGDAYLSIDYSKVSYFTDTGRSWSINNANIRDKVNSDNKININDTAALIERISLRKDKKVCIQTHPERWAYNGLTFIRSIAYDFIANSIKTTLKR